MLEEYVMGEEVSDDVGESLMLKDEDFEPPEVPFQPKPTSVSIAVVGDFSGESNFITTPKADRQDELQSDVHGANTVILEEGRGRRSAPYAPVSDRHDAAARPTGVQDVERRQQPTRGRPAQQPGEAVFDQASTDAPTRGRAPEVRSRPTRQPPPSPPVYDEELHAAPTLILDIRARRR
jgi:hypothetical protein